VIVDNPQTKAEIETRFADLALRAATGSSAATDLLSRRVADRRRPY
jgi:hypothetical protein